MSRVRILCEDEFLFRRIRAELSSLYECVNADEPALPTDIVIAEDTPSLKCGMPIDLLLSYGESLPLCEGEISRLVAALPKKPRLMLIAEDSACVIDGERIHLTELEYRLLSLLMSRAGEFFKKEELCATLSLGEGFGMLNLYIHYLRAKLEGDKRRVIISQRSLGYRISEEFIKGGSVC